MVTALLFLFRGFQIGAYITLYVYVSEVYPTRLRGTVFGLFGVGRSIGQLLSPLSALVSVHVHMRKTSTVIIDFIITFTTNNYYYDVTEGKVRYKKFMLGAF